VSESDGFPIDVEGRNSEVKNLVAGDYNVEKDSITKTTVENTSIQLY